ncbi:hypothetical protein KV097_18620 [Mumia sp. zg.B17]|uniref:hypothetical protein n=1 Tax=unclassified Mumia TaxID=2621872 RepID=UPI001C6E3D4D|nr:MULTISPECIES: hypothetical protein [unclassified Mumia]MBW9207957.1 hypothetical protein [Mumia sp. zg.B17]MBW9211751.1 hypothetical protein [Mumia sp. zg.B21]
MTTDDNEQSPFTRPSFIAAGVVVALIVVLGIVIGVVNATKEDSEATSPSADATSSAPSSSPTSPEAGTDTCNLPGEVLSGTLSTAPVAKWEYQGTTAYPTSMEYGPQRAAGGVRACYQHSPEGAVFTAANAVVLATADLETVRDWFDYFIATGPHRDSMLSQEDGSATSDGVRAEIAGFRLLFYDGDTARVDIGVRGTSEGQTVNLSMVYALVWEDGDWKLNVTDPDVPVNVAVVPELAGYIPWGP